MSSTPLAIKQQVVSYYLSEPMSQQAVSSAFHLNPITVSRILNEYGCPRYTRNTIYNKYLNESYFEVIDSEPKAYYVGLLLSDGCVFYPDDGKQNSVHLSLKTEDEYIISRFAEEVGLTRLPIRDKRGCSTLSIRSNKMCSDLAAFGITPRKTTTVRLPFVDDGQMHHLIRGILDGDGCVQSRMYRGKHRHSISFCGTPQLMAELQGYLIERIGVSTRKRYNYTTSFGEIYWSGINDVFKLGTYLYCDASFYLDRKRAIFEDFKKHYDLH